MAVAFAIARRRWRTPPTGPVVINRSHWAASRVVVALLPTQGGVCDAAQNGKVFTKNIKHTIYGGRLAFSATTAGASEIFLTNRRDIDTDKKLTWFGVGYFAYTGVGINYLYQRGPSNYGWYIGTQARSGGGINFKYFGTWFGDNGNATIAASVPSAEVVPYPIATSAAVAWEPGSSTAVTLHGWYNRRQYGSGIVTTGRDPGLSGTGSYLLHAGSSVPAPPTNLQLLLTGIITLDEYQDLHDDTFALFMPRDVPVFYSLPSSGPILSFPGVTEIGQTSARPHIYLTF